MATKDIYQNGDRTVIEINAEENKYIKRVKLISNVNKIDKTFVEQSCIGLPGFDEYIIESTSYVVDENDSRELEFSKCVAVKNIIVYINKIDSNINLLIEERDLDV